jgi:hypothetical protein
MQKRFSAKIAPLFVGTLALGMIVGCGGEQLDIDQVQSELTESKAAKIGQADFDGYTNLVQLKKCSFVVGGGNATFTPSNELSQVIYGDPNGSAHKSTFAVPPITASGATLDITSLNAEFATTGLTLSGNTATVRLSFNGQLRIAATIPVAGKIAADIVISSSNIQAAMTYDPATARVQVASVTSNIAHKTKNCGLFGWCNGLVDSALKSNLKTWIDAPLKDALAKALDNADRTKNLEDALVLMYNVKDPKTPAWTMKPASLSLAASQFSFTAERTVP